jgi:hypothetical protein
VDQHPWRSNRKIVAGGALAFVTSVPTGNSAESAATFENVRKKRAERQPFAVFISRPPAQALSDAPPLPRSSACQL